MYGDIFEEFWITGRSIQPVEHTFHTMRRIIRHTWFLSRYDH